MFDGFNFVLAAIVIAIVLLILKAVRQTKSDIDKGLKGVGPAKRDEYYKKLAEKIRAQDIRCPRCGRQAFGMLGTENKYKCQSCRSEFEGPPRIPASDG